MSAILLFVVGGVLGFILGRKSHGNRVQKPINKEIGKGYSYSERQYRKVAYLSDADRIRALNLLSANASVFLRLLKQEFLHHEVIVKNKRFFIVDRDQYPIAIFEYRDGEHAIKTMTVEDGLPLFLYKGIISSEKIKQDVILIYQQYPRKA
ncbi:hypothetical protein [Acinetobacter rathckeae]|uniref:hypothetical protein n=1 Tax=Acinetobacter rathckeae TaxID=2605272 RepID=UPI0018A2D892|nr:hypothetical protein [Acinetobacter rathckeae]MBF7688641.1 hypothetical protein [Acinetobacter rathckeae]MBF7695887.1 hypothetical protein [Acinetobacter rathckeae]